jgi:two-component system, NarL family, response regulator NreC
MPIRILIVDDHRIMRAGLKTLLSPDQNLQVVAEAASGDEALPLAQELRPDVILMDIAMPGLNALEAIRQLTKILPDTRVLVLTMHEDSSLLQAFLQAGAAGYIIKRAAENELVDAIYAVWRGMIYVHPSLMRALVTPGPKPAPPPRPADGEPLTLRETEVLRLAAHGYTNRQIAESLSISVRTVETHRANLMEKLDLHSRVELARYAENHGLL